MLAAAQGLLTTQEMDQLIGWCDERGGPGTLSTGLLEQGYRRSHVAWAKQTDGFGWLYEKVGRLAAGFNSRFFGFELTGIEQALQVARYDSESRGGYDWHTDFGQAEQTRKLSISVQLSSPEAYAGGDLELEVSSEPTKAGRERGLAIAFPSFVRHRVAPVTAGVRYSLVAWIHGPRYR